MTPLLSAQRHPPAISAVKTAITGFDWGVRRGGGAVEPSGTGQDRDQDRDQDHGPPPSPAAHPHPGELAKLAAQRAAFSQPGEANRENRIIYSRGCEQAGIAAYWGRLEPLRWPSVGANGCV